MSSVSTAPALDCTSADRVSTRNDEPCPARAHSRLPPTVHVREYLPEELIEHDPLDVAVVHAPAHDEDGVCVFNLSAQILRTVTHAELEVIGHVIADAAMASSEAINEF